MMGQEPGIFTIDEDPSASELKALISRCELFLGATMHAAIAALSSDVPTIMLSWSHKYSGLMEQIGLERFVWDMESPVEELEQLIEEVWETRSAIREVLRRYNETAQASVRLEVSRVLEIGAQSSDRDPSRTASCSSATSTRWRHST